MVPRITNSNLKFTLHIFESRIWNKIMIKTQITKPIQIRIILNSNQNPNHNWTLVMFICISIFIINRNQKEINQKSEINHPKELTNKETRFKPKNPVYIQRIFVEPMWTKFRMNLNMKHQVIKTNQSANHGARIEHQTHFTKSVCNSRNKHKPWIRRHMIGVS